MKTQPKSDKDLLMDMQQALTDYPNSPLSELRKILTGRSSRIAQAYHQLVSKEEHARRRTHTKAAMQAQHYANALPQGMKLYLQNIELSLEEVAKDVKVRPSVLATYIKEQEGITQFQKVSSLKRSYQKTQLHPKERVVTRRKDTQRYIDPKGYVLVPTPAWMERENKYSYEHQVVMLKHLGLGALPSGWVVHHVNEDKTDNHLDNLALMTNSAHMAHHHGNTHPLSKLTMWEYEEFMTWKSKQTTAT